MSSSPEPSSPRARRAFVTEEALSVSRHVLGLPLASHWRRGSAIAMDGVLVTILANAPSVLFGFAAAYVLFRVSARPKPGAGYIRRSFRLLFRVGGAVVLFAAVVNLWDEVADRVRGGGDDGRQRGVQVAVEAGEDGDLSRSLNLTGMQAVRFGADVVALHAADDEVEAREAADELLDQLHGAGVSGADARTMVRELTADPDAKRWLAATVEEVLRADSVENPDEATAPADTAAVHPDSIILAYSAAVSAGDSATADSLRPSVAAVLSRDTVRVLANAITSIGRERSELAARVEELEEEAERGPGVLSMMRSLVEDLGLGLGWFGLYFTATTAMWHGRTPGKRLFGIRVISLTGKPIGWWASFERFGGYAAGFATGLLGFLQVFWDDNRQAIHDKIAVTVVVRDNP